MQLHLKLDYCFLLLLHLPVHIYSTPPFTWQIHVPECVCAVCRFISCSPPTFPSLLSFFNFSHMFLPLPCFSLSLSTLVFPFSSSFPFVSLSPSSFSFHLLSSCSFRMSNTLLFFRLSSFFFFLFLTSILPLFLSCIQVLFCCFFKKLKLKTNWRRSVEMKVISSTFVSSSPPQLVLSILTSSPFHTSQHLDWGLSSPFTLFVLSSSSSVWFEAPETTLVPLGLLEWMLKSQQVSWTVLAAGPVWTSLNIVVSAAAAVE